MKPADRVRQTGGRKVLASDERTHDSNETLPARLNPDIVYACPKEGIIGWFDSLVVPAGAQNVEAAKKFMNFVMGPEKIALESNFAAYSNGIMGSAEFMDDALRASPEPNAPAEVPVKFGQACSPEAQKLIERAWSTLLQQAWFPPGIVPTQTPLPSPQGGVTDPPAPG